MHRVINQNKEVFNLRSQANEFLVPRSQKLIKLRISLDCKKIKKIIVDIHNINKTDYLIPHYGECRVIILSY